MTGKDPSNSPKSREDRLKAALKANMARRKAQARMRRITGGRVHEPPEGGSRTGHEAGKDERDG